MTCSITYSTRTGNTKILAEAAKLAITNEFITYFGPINDRALKADRIYLGFWTNNGICDELTQQFISKLGNQQVILFGTAGLGYSIDYFDKIIQRTRKLFPEKARFYASFMCQGKMPQEARIRFLQLKRQNPSDPQIDRFIKTFDIGVTHPDKTDIANFSSWLRKM